MADVWVLGGSGRSGRGVADDLAEGGVAPVLVGRDAERLRSAARGQGYATLVAADVAGMAAAVREARPAVVVNTVGPFATSAPALVDACLAAGSHYVDLANDVLAVPAVLARDDDAVRAGRTLVTGAGFGVTATESVVVWLCAAEGADRRRAVRVRTDMIPSLATTAGPLGEALARSLVDGLPGVPGGRRFQGRQLRGGRLVPAPLGGGVAVLETPDGDRVTTSLVPFGELVAAQRASGAADVASASSEAPSGRLARVAFVVAGPLLGVGPLRRLAARRLAAVRLKDAAAPRARSWGHATVSWADGTTSQGWLALPEAQTTTVRVCAEVTRRLVRGEGRPGAFTPAALFGPGLAESVGGTYSGDAAARA